MKIVVTKDGKISEYEARRGQTILTFLKQNHMNGIEASCGGIGRCGKCLVQVEGRGEVLACKTLVTEGMHLILKDTMEANIVEHGMCYNTYPADCEEALLAACDIGTTTVVCHLIDGRTGKVRCTVSAPNEQKIYGADVVSRIERASDGELEALHGAIAHQLSCLLSQLLKKVKTEEKIHRLTVAGNTVMCHLLAGISPEAIGIAPFMPEELFGKVYDGKALGIDCCRQVEILPCVAGYVGADITADILAVIPDKAKGQWLLLDIGTNGEMAIGNAYDGFICCATAAGPAFEGASIVMGMPAANGAVSAVKCMDQKLEISVIGGGEPVGICGSGLLDALAVFLETGLMDESGMLVEKDETESAFHRYIGSYEGQACVWLTRKICVTQEDIRNLQLAKAAIAAGIRVLLKAGRITGREVTNVLLAGGFGSFLNKESAAAIGLIPRELLPVTRAVGNAAGEGVILAAVSKDARQQINTIRDKMHYLELSLYPDFADWYMDCIDFGDSNGISPTTKKRAD